MSQHPHSDPPGNLHMKITLLCALITLSCLTHAAAQNWRVPEDYDKNEHVGFDVSRNGDIISLRYQYKDHWNIYRIHTQNLSVPTLLRDIPRYGIPQSIFRPYYPHEAAARNRILQSGLFKRENGRLAIDYRAVIVTFAPTYCRPIAEHIAQTLKNTGRDTRAERIAMAMAFVQDIPYGQPHFDDEDWFFGGLNPPPLLLLTGFGDCDSKSVLFCGIMSYLIDCDDLILFSPPGHVLPGIRGVPGAGMTYISYRSSKYILCETAGPARPAFGEKDTYYNEKYKVIPLNLSRAEMGPMIPIATPVIASTPPPRQDRPDSWYVDSWRSTTQGGSSSGGSHGTTTTRNTSGSNTITNSYNTTSGYNTTTTSSSSSGWSSQSSTPTGTRLSSISPSDINEYVVVWVGAGSGWWLGPIDTKTLELRRDAQHWVASGSLGFRLAESFEGQRSSLLLFTATGGRRHLAIEVRSYMGVPSWGGPFEYNDEFIEYEAGLSLGEFLILQAGRGRLHRTLVDRDGRDVAGEDWHYTTASAGIAIRIGVVDLHTTAKALYYDAIPRPELRVQTQLALRLELF